MHASPFACLRPNPEHAAEFASLPYDVFDRKEAAEFVAKNPKSFLAIDRPETAFEPGHDMYADDVYTAARRILEERAADGTLMRDPNKCYYLYRLEQGGRSQTGIVAACSLDDYMDGTIKRHELTRRDKEDDRVRHIEATGCQTGPIFLAYRDEPALAFLVSSACAAEPLYDFTDAEGVRQTVWRVGRPEAVEAFELMLGRMPCAYIADGHHRAASAARVCRSMREEAGDSLTGEEPFNYLLCVLFPASELTVLPYNRVVADANGLSADELLDAVRAANFEVGEAQPEPVEPAEKGQAGMYANGCWRLLTWKGDAERDADPVASLDASRLQNNVLGPVLGIGDPRTDARISFVGGNAGAAELERRAGEGGVAFNLYATSVEDLMGVADAGLLMPPKSTWFEPKLRSGLFIRKIFEPRTEFCA
ncbi:DUF1015 domain-containing protein [Paratractidigestivibacter sp.]|uniref:DUF1015 domain-containing protein n=1 Tax=Paratractidigestivibacter sp. TaxID=2847316 RepID=UPI002AC92A5A|nr:DUF1015 domain-containing protein [Paratractidigestivibacter sp.]